MKVFRPSKKSTIKINIPTVVRICIGCSTLFGALALLSLTLLHEEAAIAAKTKDVIERHQVGRVHTTLLEEEGMHAATVVNVIERHKVAEVQLNPTPRPTFRRPLLTRHRQRANQTQCPRTTPLDGSCIHGNNKLACVPLRESDSPQVCQRPCGAFALKMRGAGGVVIREGLLMGVYGGASFGAGKDESFLSQEGWTLGSGDLDGKFRRYKLRGAVFLTVLRNPVERILSRYWYEGRWNMGVSKEKVTPSTARSLEDWLEVTLRAEWAASSGRLWASVSNYYVKTLVGWKGTAMCEVHLEESGEDRNRCVNGVGLHELETAKSILEHHFDMTLITEWLSTDGQMEWLGQVFCFPTRPLVKRKHKRFGLISWPNMNRKAAPGGHSNHRKSSWEPEAWILKRIEEWNALDIELYKWARERARLVIGSLNTSKSGRRLNPLPVA